MSASSPPDACEGAQQEETAGVVGGGGKHLLGEGVDTLPLYTLLEKQSFTATMMFAVHNVYTERCGKCKHVYIATLE